MTPERLEQLLEQVARGKKTPEQAMEILKLLPFEDLGFAKVDHHRTLRRGFPEVVFGIGKNSEDIAAIAERLSSTGQTVLVTKTTETAFKSVSNRVSNASWYEKASAIVIGEPPPKNSGVASILCAGTSDIHVAEEAAITAELMGCNTKRIFDVGVAGLHRLLAHQDSLISSDVLIVVAGMDGALPSVVSGLTNSVVIAVPTSIGYGSSFKGLSALLSMLNSCSPGVAVVNIDNGFGAGYLAGTICKSIH